MLKWKTQEHIFLWAIVLIVLIIIGMALYGYFTGAWITESETT